MKKKIICWPSTVYALLLYLIYAKDEEIDVTKYIFSDIFPKGFANRVKYGYTYREPQCLTSILWIDWLILRVHYWLKLPLLHKNDSLYIQDHNRHCLRYIYNHKYILLEDSAKHTYFMLESGQNEYGIQLREVIDRKKSGNIGFQERILDILYSPLLSFPFGSSPKAIGAILSVDDPSIIFKDKKKIILPPLDNNLWKSFSDYKKKRILEIYNVTEKDLEVFKKVEYILLSQPLYPDMVSEDEHRHLFEKVLSKYDREKVLIKTHPRDKFDYCKNYPGVAMFNKPIPAEIFNLIGLKFKKAITMFSGSVRQFDCEVDWYGTEISDKIVAIAGHICAPEGANTIII